MAKRFRYATFSRRPSVIFKGKFGKVFMKRFKSRQSAARAVRGWRNKGGKVLAINNRVG